jgi:hypothetical protein
MRNELQGRLTFATLLVDLSTQHATAVLTGCTGQPQRSSKLDADGDRHRTEGPEFTSQAHGSAPVSLVGQLAEI